MSKYNLGAGLDTLFTSNKTNVQVKKTLRIHEIEPNKNQPRKEFDQDALNALALSIKEHGIIQPIVVRPIAGGFYQIVAGERRWRAARIAGLNEVPVSVLDIDDSETMQIAVLENLQRENLNPIEEAKGYRELSDTFNMTQEQIAGLVGKSRSVVANTLRLLALPEEIIEMIEMGEISAGHAKVLLSLESKDEMIAIAQETINKKWTVRDTEKAIQIKMKEKEAQKSFKAKKKETLYTEVELSLKDCLGRKVKVERGRKKGVLSIEFYDNEDLLRLAELLSKYSDEEV